MSLIRLVDDMDGGVDLACPESSYVNIPLSYNPHVDRHHDWFSYFQLLAQYNQKPGL